MKRDPFYVLIVGLAAWRLSRLLVKEDGPFMVFERIRAVSGVPTIGYPQHHEIPLLTGILRCPFCCSVWAAGVLWLLRRTAVAQVLAAAGVAAILIRLEDRE